MIPLYGKNPFYPKYKWRAASGSHFNSINIRCLLCASCGAKGRWVVSREREAGLTSSVHSWVKVWGPGAPLASGTDTDFCLGHDVPSSQLAPSGKPSRAPVFSQLWEFNRTAYSSGFQWVHDMNIQSKAMLCRVWLSLEESESDTGNYQRSDRQEGVIWL